MINFDAVDFSERRPEEVISFFWRSVYIIINVCEYGILGGCINVTVDISSFVDKLIHWYLNSSYQYEDI